VTGIAVIGGTGSRALVDPDTVRRHDVETPYGRPSSPILSWRSDGSEMHFLARHGLDGTIPPHRVNYRANIWAISQLQPRYLLSINTVGGISEKAMPGHLVFPGQLIDYTWGREHTFADSPDQPVRHVEFSEPVSEPLRQQLVDNASALGLNFLATGIYGVTQGPRLETAAEIDRMARDGCTLVGMTAMPEASLARELDLDYAICAVVVNRAAGRSNLSGGIHAEIQRYLDRGMSQAKQLLNALIRPV
jgi:5'-methylthioinosine phosphorylase